MSRPSKIFCADLPLITFGLTASEHTLNAVHMCRRPSSNDFQLKCRGGLMAAEAVALLKEFYATGNPKGAQPYSQG